MKQYTSILVAIGMVLGVSAAVLLPATTSLALDPGDAIGTGVDAAGGSSATPLEDQIRSIVNVLLFVLGAIAVIVIVVGGIRYATSNGDSNQITAAKNTILYAVIGLVVALLAYAIVNWIIDAF